MRYENGTAHTKNLARRGFFEVKQAQDLLIS